MSDNTTGQDGIPGGANPSPADDGELDNDALESVAGGASSQTTVIIPTFPGPTYPDPPFPTGPFEI